MRCPDIFENERGRTVLETLFALILVSVFLLVAFERYGSSLRAAKESALVIELSNIRTAVNLYAMTRGRLPSSLKEMAAEKVAVTKRDISGKEYDIVLSSGYAEGMVTDVEGFPTDAFENRFSYDPATGMVRSSTTGYESW